jgi:hypothetical protein
MHIIAPRHPRAKIAQYENQCHGCAEQACADLNFETAARGIAAAPRKWQQHPFIFRARLLHCAMCAGKAGAQVNKRYNTRPLNA